MLLLPKLKFKRSSDAVRCAAILGISSDGKRLKDPPAVAKQFTKDKSLLQPFYTTLRTNLIGQLGAYRQQEL